MARNDYQRHIAADRVKWVIAFVLIIAIIGGLVLGALEIWTDKGPSHWGKSDAAQTEKVPDKTPGTGGMVTPGGEEEKPGTGGNTGNTGNTGDTGDGHVDASESHGIRLMAAKIPIEMYESYGIAPASVESAYTITATIEPENATNKEVDWTVYFQNPSSEWATGNEATDFVTIQPGAEASCLVTCTKAFNEPIMVKVASREDSSIYATKQFDYVMRFRTNLPLAEGIFGTHTLFFEKSNYTFKTALSADAFITDDVGTVKGQAVLISVRYCFKNSEIPGKLKEKNVVAKVNELLGDDIVDLNYDDYVFTLISNQDIAIPWTAFFKTKNGSRLEELNAKAINTLKSGLLDVISEIGIASSTAKAGYYECTVKNVYNGQTVEERTEKFVPSEKNTSKLTVGITDLQFEDAGNLVF